jgi:hypothetical protein
VASTRFPSYPTTTKLGGPPRSCTASEHVMPTPLSRLGLLVRTNTPVEPELVGVFREVSILCHLCAMPTQRGSALSIVR